MKKRIEFIGILAIVAATALMCVLAYRSWADDAQPATPKISVPAVNLRNPGPDASEVDWIEYLTLRLDQQGVKTHPTYLPDGSQVDILTDSVAWEVERCKKWKESIGQSIFYAEMTHRTPGVWILKEGGDEHDFARFMVAVAALRGTENFKDFRVRVIDIRSGREWGK